MEMEWPGQIQETLRNCNMRGMKVYHMERDGEGGIKDYTMFLTWIIGYSSFTEIRSTAEDAELGRKITSSVSDMLDLTYLSKSWICECELQTARYIGLTFKTADWIEAQAKYLSIIWSKKSGNEIGKKLWGKWEETQWCHRSQENPLRWSKWSTVSYIPQTKWNKGPKECPLIINTSVPLVKLFHN